MSTTTTHDRGITTAEAANRLNTTEQTVQQMCAAKLLPACKLRHRWRVSEQGLAAYLRGEKPAKVREPTPAESRRRREAEQALPPVSGTLSARIIANQKS